MPNESSEKWQNYIRRYRLVHKDEISKKNHEYREKNKEKIKIRNEKYRIENKEKIKVKDKKYYLKNREKILKRSKKYYQENTERKLEYTRKRSLLPKTKEECNQRIVRNRVFIREYKKTQKCERCGENHPSCLAFHHLKERGKKNFSIGKFASHSIKSIQEEIAKCIVLCANCHCKEHWK